MSAAAGIFSVAKWNVTCLVRGVSNSLLRRVLPLSAAFFTTAALLRAHPGHDGHEFTWDFGHLANHPLATLGSVLVLTGAAWGVSRLLATAFSLRPVRVERRRD